MIAIIGNNLPEDTFTLGLHEYLRALHNPQELSFVGCPLQDVDVYELLLICINNPDITKVYTIIDNRYLPALLQLSKEHGAKCNKISYFFQQSSNYEVLSIASFHSRFIILNIHAYNRCARLKNVDFLPQPIVARFNDRKQIEVPVLTFCGRGKSEHNLYINYTNMVSVAHNLPCEYLLNEKELDLDELLIQRKKATHNVLFLDSWYVHNTSSSFLDSFTYLLPIIAPQNAQIEFYRNGLDIGFICDNAEQMLANVHYVSTSFDNNRYIQQIENLRFIREYFSGKALAKRYNI